MRGLWQRWRAGFPTQPPALHQQRFKDWRSKGKEMCFVGIWKTRALRTLTLAAAPLALTACDGLIASGARIDDPPPSLVQECEAPLRLPARDATQAEVERWWMTDRARLLDCGEKHAGLAVWASDVAGALRGR